MAISSNNTSNKVAYIIKEPSSVEVKFSEADIKDKSKAFYLDAPFPYNSVVNITVKSLFASLNTQSNFVGNKIYSHTLISNGVNSNGEQDNNIYIKGTATVVGKTYPNIGAIEFFFDLTPISEEIDNITVEFEPNIVNNVVTDLNYGIEFGAENDDRLFLHKGNKVYYSAHNDYLYFPINNWIEIGRKDNDIVAFSRLTDSNVAIYKRKNNYKDTTAYYMTYNSVIVDDIPRTIFTTKSGAMGETPVNNDVCEILANDHLILSDNGVYGIELNENIKSDERYALERSGFINTLLKEHKDLSSAKAIVYKNRYYLAIDDVVYVADARHKSSARKGDMKDTFNYEWHYWTNISVKQWLIIDDELYFLSNDNNLNKFYNRYEDVKKIQLNTGAITTVSNDNYSLQFSELHEDLMVEKNELIVNGVSYLMCDIDDYRTRFKLKDEDGNYIDTGTLDLTQSFFVLDKKPVVSIWETPVLSLGTTLFLKNLLSSTLVCEPNIEGSLQYGYRTNNNSSDIASVLRVNKLLDFSDLDFNDFSFGNAVASSRTFKTRVRNFCFIKFVIRSTDNRDCALNNFTITYNIGRKNKGVR